MGPRLATILQWADWPKGPMGLVRRRASQPRREGLNAPGTEETQAPAVCSLNPSACRSPDILNQK